MILRDRVPCRLTLPGLFGSGLLMLLALPSWTIAEPPADRDRPVAASDEGALVAQPTPVVGREVVALADDHDDNDPDKPMPTKKAPRVKADKPRKAENDTTAPGASKGKIKNEIDLSDLEKAFGPDSEFVKNLEKIAPEIERAMAQNFGPGSEFETKLKELGERMEKKFGHGSEFERKRKMKEPTKEEGQDRPAPAARPAPRPGRSSKEQRIKDLESRINKLMLELKMLKAEDSAEDDEPRPGALDRR